MLRLWKDHLRDHPKHELISKFLLCAGKRALAALFPYKCLVCGRYIRFRPQPVTSVSPTVEQLLSLLFCPACLETGVNPIESPLCTRCGKPFASRTGSDHPCSDCFYGSNPTHDRIGRIRAFGNYDALLKESIHLLKYGKKTSLARPLGRLMFQTFQRNFVTGPLHVIVPVPLHRKRLVKRGFNQAYLLIHEFSRLFKAWAGVVPGWTVSNRLLFRSRNTLSQTGFDKAGRAENIKGAFRVKHPAKVKGKRIMLTDDVYTTGATATEAASTLFKAGARSVDLLVLARA
ncbi:MAG: ComF family protein [Desulfobacteraceae bacterium]|nr:ComF family protein [Desulfobacteraceae bacterium]